MDKNRFYCVSVIIFLASFNFSNIANADSNITNSKEDSGSTRNTKIENTVSGTAQDWGISQEEFSHYQQLMQGRNGKWYRQLTPAEVLGLNAQSDDEQKHFAEIVAKEQHDKLANELAFDSAVHSALLRLYPNEPVIRHFDMSAFNPVKPNNKITTPVLQSGDHLVLFEQLENDGDVSFISRLTNIIKIHRGVILDIFCIKYAGKTKDVDIQNFAKKNQLPIDLVNNGRITLNHDNGKFSKISGAQLPYLLLVRSGNSQPVNLGDLS